MAVLRQFNALGQARIDVPHLRAIESAVAGDFDCLAGYMIAGKVPLVITGFKIDPSTVLAIATNLKVIVANSSLLHYNASESGTIFRVPATTSPEQLNAANTNVVGSFVSSTDNYVGIDLVRAADTTTKDKVAFLSADSKLESQKTVPLGRTLQYRFVISTRAFSSASNVCPIAIVTVDSSGNCSKLTDARRMMFRLGSGGDVPNTQNSYAWSQRKDSPNFATSSATDPFSGGDKDILSLKQWQDSVMTRLWEVGGGEYWYSSTADRDAIMVRTGATFSSSNDNFEVSGGTDVHWKGLKFQFANSTATTNTVADQATSSPGLTDLHVGECVYVDVDRATDAATITAVGRTPLATVGITGLRPGSRFVLVWRTSAGWFSRGSPYAIGPVTPVATGLSLGIVKLASPFTDVNNPEVPTMDGVSSNGTALKNVVAAGLTRSTANSGAITIGGGANDTSLNLTGNGTSVWTNAGALTISSTAGALSISAGAASTWQTTVGALAITAAAALNLTGNGVSTWTNAGALTISATGGSNSLSLSSAYQWSLTGTSTCSLFSTGAITISGGAAGSVWDTNNGLLIGTKDASALTFKTNAANAWQIGSNGDLTAQGTTSLVGPIALKRVAVADADYVGVVNDSLISYSSLSAPRAVTLAHPTTSGHVVIIKNETSNTSTITINDTGGAGNMEGGGTQVINSSYGFVRLYWSGAKWFLF